MERGGEEVDLEPRIKQYGFNVASAAAKAIAKSSVPKTPERPLPLKSSGRNSSLDAGATKSSWKWLERRASSRQSALRSSDSQASSGISSNSLVKPRWSGSSDGGGLRSAFKLNKGGSHSLAERKSTGDSSQWALGADWQEEEEQESPLSALREANRFRGFKDDCEAGSFTLGNLSQAVQSNGRIEVVGTLHSSEGVRGLVKSVVGGLRAWQQPEASSEGLGGTYFFMNEKGEKQAIVKPCDEEPLAPNNPKGFVGRELGEPGLKPTVRVGEAAMREVAAFLLDHHQFAGVPATALGASCSSNLRG